MDVQNSAFALTPREIEVLTHSARGENAEQVGEELGITRRTVEQHRRTIARKLRASNIAHAVALALTSGIIVPP